MTCRRTPFAAMTLLALAGGLMFSTVGASTASTASTATAGTLELAFDQPTVSDAVRKKFLDGGTADIIARSQPSIDLELAFEDQSADITPETAAELLKLGRALTSENLKGNVYLIAAHTDASASADLSQALSEQRAAAVKAFLRDRFGIADDRLVTVGYGSEKLKNKADPLARENNRIEIINLGKESGDGKNGRSAAPPPR
jgi:outer membrane protein OmpA-like peptidoglycan-associated protein